MPASRGTGGPDGRPSPTILLCPEWFALPQPDWPEDVQLAGFPHYHPGAADAEVQRFIAAHGAPVVCTPGTGINDAGPFFERAAEALQRLDLPGIFLGRGVPEAFRNRPALLCSRYVDLAWLLPHARAVVHHGGIGSTAAALQAGILQVVVPNRFDQPDNAMRVAQLGLGAAILSGRFTGADWADLLKQMLDSAHIRLQVATARQLLIGEDGIGHAVRTIEGLSERRWCQRPLAA